jgi:hypothetical protein
VFNEIPVCARNFICPVMVGSEPRACGHHSIVRQRIRRAYLSLHEIDD